MKKLTVGQKRIISEMLSNIAVAWFVAGAITPIFSSNLVVIGFVTNLVISLTMTLIFSLGALEMSKGIKS